MKPSYQLLWPPPFTLSFGLHKALQQSQYMLHRATSPHSFLLMTTQETPPKQQGMTRNRLGLQVLVIPRAAITQQSCHKTFLQCLGKRQGQGNHKECSDVQEDQRTKLSHKECQP